MKKYILLALLFALPVQAADCDEQFVQSLDTEKLELTTDVPGYLKGATITVTKADGSKSVVPAEKFKVVPRAQQFIVTKIETSKIISCSAKKNRVSVLGGYGARNGLDVKKNGSTTTVESKSGAVAGAQYQLMLGDTFSVGAQVQTNETGQVLIGVDF